MKKNAKVTEEKIEFGKQHVVGVRPVGMQYANEEEKSWKKSYVVIFWPGTNQGVLVNADDEEDALDAAVDSGIDDLDWKGIEVPEEEVDFDEDEQRYFHKESGATIDLLGNYGRGVLADEIAIIEVPTPPPASASPNRKSVRSNEEVPVHIFQQVLISNLMQYDRKESAREAARRHGHVNIYRMGLLLAAAHRVEDEIGTEALAATSPDALEEWRSSVEAQFETGFSPVKKILKDLDVYLQTGKRPRIAVDKS